MQSDNLEERYAIKFCFKLGKNTRNTRHSRVICKIGSFLWLIRVITWLLENYIRLHLKWHTDIPDRLILIKLGCFFRSISSYTLVLTDIFGQHCSSRVQKRNTHKNTLNIPKIYQSKCKITNKIAIQSWNSWLYFLSTFFCQKESWFFFQ